MNILETVDVWQKLRETTKPIYIYGMGNGADRIMDILAAKNIPVAGVFASDEFVRGHSFRGFRVQRLSEIETSETEFIVVLAFGSNRPEVINHIKAISNRHNLIAPDLPVCPDELFDRKLFEVHKTELETVYNLLEDEQSKKLFENTINYKISGNLSYINDGCDFADILGSLSLTENEIYCDCGAYTGDTIADSFKAIHAFEPSAKTFARLRANYGDNNRIHLYNAAVWSENTTVSISNANNRNNRVTKGSGNVKAVRLEDVVPNATLVKLDVEGAETKALAGMETLIKSGVKLICAVYHRSEDLYKIPLMLKKLNPSYRFKLKRIRCIPAWDLFITADSNS
jgi:FkbM family methyltransferase